jgi:hypothetical protein
MWWGRDQRIVAGRYDSGVQTRYLILAALITGLVILAAAAVWFGSL